MRRQILGVRIDDVSKEIVLDMVKSWLDSKRGPKLIFTPGPEFLVKASENRDFKRVLNESDLNVPDGIGLRLAGVGNRVPGVDLMIEMCRLCGQNNRSVGLIGGVNGVSEKAGEKLKSKFKKLKIKFAWSDEKADKIMNHYLIDNTITTSFDNVDVLFVGLGHPKQEMMLLNMVKDNKFKIGMGVGGSFDLISGTKKRAPKVMTDLGLEWLWRGLQDPRHFARVWSATGGFLWLLAWSKLRC